MTILIAFVLGAIGGAAALGVPAVAGRLRAWWDALPPSTHDDEIAAIFADAEEEAKREAERAQEKARREALEAKLVAYLERILAEGRDDRH